jgi:hypothetical protein
VQLATPQTYPAPRPLSRPAPASSRAPSPQPAEPAAPYQSCALLSPVNEQTLPNALSVPASVRLDPQQRAGDQVFLLLDGARVPGLPTAGDSYTISPMERGTHTLQAVVLDSNGQLVCQSAPVTFNVLQPSLLNPASPLRRH